MTGVVQQSLFSDAHAKIPGLLQAVDPRIKIVTVLFLLVMISLLHTPAALLFLSLTAVGIAVLSRIGPLFFISRVWLVVPFFSAAVVLPSILNIFTPGDPLFVLLRLDQERSLGPLVIPSEVAVTAEGIRTALLFVLRVGASVSFAVLLALTTPWNRIFAALRSLGVPRMFVMTLSMTERYLFVFLRLIQDMYLARMSRTIRPLSVRQERSWTASRIGVAFRRSVDMSEDVHKAMLSRGFQGDFPAMDRLHLSPRDLVWTISVLLLAIGLLLFERVLRS